LSYQHLDLFPLGSDFFSSIGSLLALNTTSFIVAQQMFLQTTSDHITLCTSCSVL